ncbi:hypothetical protein DWZ35_09195 [Bacteroides caccae]|nr:hypothetical protein DWZ35_09195 [Bacteroides caccae]
MGREENNFHIDPFINYVNPENGTSHKIKGRFYYSADNIVRPTEGSSITDILGNMGTDANTIKNIVTAITAHYTPHWSVSVRELSTAIWMMP